MPSVNRDATFNNYYQWGPGGVGRTHKVMHVRGSTVTKSTSSFASDQSALIGTFKPKWWNPFQFTYDDLKERLKELLGPEDV